MDWSTLLYLVPYLISLAISIAVANHAWRHRDVAGARSYALVAISGALWTLGYVFELLSPSLEAKIFWDNVQWVGTLTWPVAILAFALEYTGHKAAHAWRTWGLLAIVPITFLLLVVTDPFHGLVRPAAWLISGEPFSALVYDFTTATWIIAIYDCCLIFAGFFVLVRTFIRPHRFYRAQVGTILIGTLIPMLGIMLTLVGIAPALHRDMWPFTSALGNLIVIWGLVRYWLFDVVPVARDAVIESMSDAVVVLDAQNRIVDLNPAAQAIVGRTASEAIGLPVDLAFSDWPDLVEKYREVEEAYEEIAPGEGGDWPHVSLKLSPVRDQHDHLVGRLIIVRDITARKQAEQALIREKKLSDNVINSLPGIFYMFGEQGFLIRWNKRLEEVTGYSAQEIATKHATDFFEEEDKTKIARRVEQVIARGRADVEADLVTKHGERIPHFFTGQRTTLEGRVHVVGLAINITKRKRAEQAVQRRTEELEALRQMGLELIAQLDLDTLLHSIVARAVELLESKVGGLYLHRPDRNVLEVAVAIGIDPAFVGTTLHRGEGPAGKIWETGEPLIIDDYQHWAGRTAVYDDLDLRAVVGMPIRWGPTGTGEKFLGVLDVVADIPGVYSTSDVELLSLFATQAAIAIKNAHLFQDLQDQMDELKRTQAQLVQAAKMATIGQLAAGVAHEINNPMTGVLGYADLLLHNMDPDDPAWESLNIIVREAHRVRKIVRNLLDFSRQAESHRQKTSIAQVVQETMALIRPRLEAKGVLLEQRYAPGLPLLWLDPNQMKQVILNLVTNAMHATPQKGTMMVVCEREGDEVAVCVTDTGSGIPQEALPHIFEPFFTTKSIGEGTGLGLFISQGIVKDHGGHIEVESRLGEGSTFTVWLPVQTESLDSNVK